MIMMLTLFLPELVLIVMALVFFCLSFTRPSAGALQLIAVIFTGMLLSACWLTYQNSGELFYGAYRVDGFSQTFKGLIAFGLLLIVWMGSGLRGISRTVRPEYFMFLALSCLGLLLMCSAIELLTIILSIELSSYALYILIPMRQHPGRRAPLEAGIKYILFGAVATGITLYGMSYLFGLTHSTYLAEIMKVLPDLLTHQPIAVIGLVMLLCGLFYKLALFPMHFWMPDIYVGAAHETTCFVATLPKIGATALLIRLISLAGGDSTQLIWVLSIMAVLSMTLGNLSALGQDDVKRLLAYSSIAHAGYIIVGILSMNELGLVSATYYVYGYMLMNVACFYVIYHLAPSGQNIYFTDLKGLYKRSPLMAAILACGSIGLAGIPPMIGFTGKFLIFIAVLQEKYYWLMGFAVVNVCISAFYYLRLVRAAYSSIEQETQEIRLDVYTFLLGLLIIIAIIAGGIFPQNFIYLTKIAISSILY